MTSTERRFDAGIWLGYSINTLSVNTPSPFSVQNLQQSGVMILQATRRAINMSSTTNRTQWGLFDIYWGVPSNVVVNTDDRSFDGDLKTFESGSDVLREMSADVSFDVEYMGVSVSSGVSYATSSHFSSDQQYAFLTKNISGYTARISDYDTFVNQSLINAALALPDWDQAKQDVASKYMNFFHTYGTHTIVQAQYGWKYQLQCSQSNSSSDETENFALNVHVKYMGDSVDASYKTSSKYTTFDKKAEVQVNAIGGDPSKAALVQENPANIVEKKGWLDEAGTKPDEGIISVSISPVSSVFDNLTDDGSGKYSRLSKQLGFALFDLQSGCRRQITMRGPLEFGHSINLFENLTVRIVSTNGAFVSPDPGSADTKNRTLVDSSSQGALGENDATAGTLTGFSLNIQSDRSPTIKLALQSSGWQSPFSPHPPGFSYTFSVERVGSDGQNQVVSSKQVPWNPGNVQFAVNSVELDLKPELDFWW